MADNTNSVPGTLQNMLRRRCAPGHSPSKIRPLSQKHTHMPRSAFLWLELPFTVCWPSLQTWHVFWVALVLKRQANQQRSSSSSLHTKDPPTHTHRWNLLWGFRSYKLSVLKTIQLTVHHCQGELGLVLIPSTTVVRVARGCMGANGRWEEPSAAHVCTSEPEEEDSAHTKNTCLDGVLARATVFCFCDLSASDLQHPEARLPSRPPPPAHPCLITDGNLTY